MSKRARPLVLRQMLDHSREVVLLAHGRTRADLDNNKLLNLSPVRLLEIVGEAATRMPPEDRARYPKIPWTQIVGMRNRLIHGYDAVDLDVVWEIISQDVPRLILALEAALMAEDKE